MTAEILPSCQGPCEHSGLKRSGTVWLGADSRIPGNLILAFGMTVSWIGMTAADARALAQDILRVTEAPQC